MMDKKEKRNPLGGLTVNPDPMQVMYRPLRWTLHHPTEHPTYWTVYVGPWVEWAKIKIDGTLDD